MRAIFVSLIISLSVLQTSSAENAIVFNKEESGFKKLLVIDKKEFFITSTTIYTVNKKDIQQKILLLSDCYDACVYKNAILLATKDGLKIFNTKENTIKDVASVTDKTEHVAVDKENNIWFTKEFGGGYKIQNDSVLRIIDAPAIYSLATTQDSNVWIGTNIGLYKISLAKNKIDRFVEEGIEGFELPDNLVEKIYADDASNIWAVMPDDISFISGAGNDDEIPDYRYVGSKQNKVLDICKTPLGSRSYLFATKEGVIYTADVKGDQLNHTGEIHQQFHEPAMFLNGALLEKPDALKDAVVNQIQIAGKEIIFITDKGLWRLKLNNLKQHLSKLS